MADILSEVLNARQQTMASLRRHLRDNDSHLNTHGKLTGKINQQLTRLGRPQTNSGPAMHEMTLNSMTAFIGGMFQGGSKANRIDAVSLERPFMDLKESVEIFVEQYQTDQAEDYSTDKTNRLLLFKLLQQELKDTTKVVKDLHLKGGKKAGGILDGLLAGGRGGAGARGLSRRSSRLLPRALKLGGVALGAGLGLMALTDLAEAAEPDGEKPDTTSDANIPDVTPATADKPDGKPPPVAADAPDAPPPSAAADAANSAADITGDTQVAAAPPITPPVEAALPDPVADAQLTDLVNTRLTDGSPKGNSATIPAAFPPAAAAELTPPSVTAGPGPRAAVSPAPIPAASPSVTPVPSEPPAQTMVPAEGPIPEVGTPANLGPPPYSQLSDGQARAALPPHPTKSTTGEDPFIANLKLGIIKSTPISRHAVAGGLNFDFSDYVHKLIIDVDSVRDLTFGQPGANSSINNGSGSGGIGGLGGGGGNSATGGGATGGGNNIDPASFNPGFHEGSGGTAAAFQHAASHLGQDKYQIQDYISENRGGVNAATTAWCSAFVNSSLASAGVEGSHSAVANSFQTWGRGLRQGESVAQGDVLLQTRGLGPGMPGGHVGMSTGKTRVGPNGQVQYEMLSGNSSTRTGAVALTWENANELMVRHSDAGENTATAAAPPPVKPSTPLTATAQADAAPTAPHTDAVADAATPGKQQTLPPPATTAKANPSEDKSSSFSTAANDEHDIDEMPIQLNESGLMLTTRMG